MKFPKLPLSCLAIGLLLASGQSFANETLRSTVYLGATLIDGRGGPAVWDGALVVVGNDIVAVGRENDVVIPADAELVDVSGTWIMPGLIDTHVHFFESGRLYFNLLISNFFGDPDAEDQWVRDRLDYTLGRYLCAGVTTAVSLGGPESFELLARERSQALEYAPQVLVAGGPIGENGVDLLKFEGKPTSFVARTEEDMRRTIRELKARGMDLIKLGYLGSLGSGEPVPLEEYVPVLAAAADEAHKLGMPVLTHIMNRVEAEAIVDTNLDAFAHLPFDDATSDEFISRVVSNGVAVAPTLAVFKREIDVLKQQLELLPIERRCADPEVLETYDDFAETPLYGSWSGTLLSVSVIALLLGILLWRWKRFGKWAKAATLPFILVGLFAAYLSHIGNFTRALAWMYDSMLSASAINASGNMKRLVEAGATLIIGSDSSHVGTPHGSSMHVEMQLIQDAGVPAEVIIPAASRNAAEVLGISDRTGTLEAGKSADFLILAADPLQDIANAQRIQFVVSDGRLFTPAELNAHRE